MIRKLTLALACTATAVLGIVAAPAQALTFNLGQLIANNGSFSVGDKLFSGFNCNIVQSGLTSPASCDTISVATIDNDPFGIRFQAPFAAFANPSNPFSTLDVLLEFFVEATAPNKFIESVDLAFNGAFAGTGFTNVTETIRDTNGNIIGQLAVFNPPTDLQDPPLEPGDFNLTSPQKKIQVSKDILLTAFSTPQTPTSQATISFIDQRFRQTEEVPEPGTVSALLALGSIGIGAILKKIQLTSS